MSTVIFEGLKGNLQQLCKVDIGSSMDFGARSDVEAFIPVSEAHRLASFGPL